MSLFSVSEVARQLDVPPRDISDLFYARVLDDQLCPVVGRRRVIPAGYIDTIRAALASRENRSEPITA